MGYYSEIGKQREEEIGFNEFVNPPSLNWYEYLCFWVYPSFLLILIIDFYFRIKKFLLKSE